MIIDTEVRLLFPDFYSNFFYDNNQLIFEKIKNNKIIKNNLFKTSENYLSLHSKKNSVKENWVCGLPFGSLNNIKKQHQYFLELREKKKNYKFFFTANLNNNNFTKIKKFFFIKKNISLYSGIEINYEYNQNIINSKRLIKFIKECSKKKLIVRLWGSHISTKTKPNSRGSQLEIFFLIKNLQSTNFILGGMGNGIYSYLYYKGLKKYFKKVKFATSIPLSLKSLKVIEKSFYKKIIFGSDFPFNSFMSQKKIIIEIKSIIKNKERLSFILNKNAKKLLK
jgi:hypothetical protein